MTTGEPGGWVELRVHGVSGTPPEDLLDRPHVVQVDGDARSRFFRVTDAQGQVVDGAPGPDAHVLEGFHWGSWTSGSWRNALWLLVLPFGLVNLAAFMLPPPKALPDPLDRDAMTPGSLRARWASLAALRGLGLVLTMIAGLALTQVVVDVVGTRWLGDLDGVPERVADLGPAAGLVVVVAIVVLVARRPPPGAPADDGRRRRRVECAVRDAVRRRAVLRPRPDGEPPPTPARDRRAHRALVDRPGPHDRRRAGRAGRGARRGGAPARHLRRRPRRRRDGRLRRPPRSPRVAARHVVGAARRRPDGCRRGGGRRGRQRPQERGLRDRGGRADRRRRRRRGGPPRDRGLARQPHVLEVAAGRGTAALVVLPALCASLGCCRRRDARPVPRGRVRRRPGAHRRPAATRRGGRARASPASCSSGSPTPSRSVSSRSC